MTRRSILRPILCLITFGLAFYVTHLPPSNLPQLGRFDKLLHFAGFVYLGMMALWQVLPARMMPSRKQVLAVLLIILAYAALDELTQPLVHRDCELLDWAADALGAAVGIALLYSLHRFELRKADASQNPA